MQTTQHTAESGVGARILAVRVGRSLFGLFLMGGGVASALLMPYGEPADVAGLFLWTVPSALLAGVGATIALRWTLPRMRMLHPLPLAGGPTQPIAAAGSRLRATALDDALARYATASIALPLAGLALVMPLTLHAPFALLDGDLRDLEKWMVMSVVLVGHVHIALAAFCYRFATRVRAGSRALLAPTAEAMRALGWCTLLACAPGIILLAIPPVLVMATGLAFVPASWVVVARWYWREEEQRRRARRA
jgi:hypothetical protein